MAPSISCPLRYRSDRRTNQIGNDRLEHAGGITPESFGRVVILLNDCKVNYADVKSFVDSGTQRTTIANDCPVRCGILHLKETRFHVIATGVDGA